MPHLAPCAPIFLSNSSASSQVQKGPGQLMLHPRLNTGFEDRKALACQLHYTGSQGSCLQEHIKRLSVWTQHAVQSQASRDSNAPHFHTAHFHVQHLNQVLCLSSQINGLREST